jgi:hypothetical protein
MSPVESPALCFREIPNFKAEIRFANCVGSLPNPVPISEFGVDFMIDKYLEVVQYLSYALVKAVRDLVHFAVASWSMSQ